MLHGSLWVKNPYANVQLFEHIGRTKERKESRCVSFDFLAFLQSRIDSLQSQVSRPALYYVPTIIAMTTTNCVRRSRHIGRRGCSCRALLVIIIAAWSRWDIGWIVRRFVVSVATTRSHHGSLCWFRQINFWITIHHLSVHDRRVFACLLHM